MHCVQLPSSLEPAVPALPAELQAALLLLPPGPLLPPRQLQRLSRQHLLRRALPLLPPQPAPLHSPAASGLARLPPPPLLTLVLPQPLHRLRCHGLRLRHRDPPLRPPPSLLRTSCLRLLVCPHLAISPSCHCCHHLHQSCQATRLRVSLERMPNPPGRTTARLRSELDTASRISADDCHRHPLCRHCHLCLLPHDAAHQQQLTPWMTSEVRRWKVMCVYNTIAS
mmetsp:Transcript_5907/g.12990  ORF Transcript_5907/g.12990 Transcript_5907/m.12990 type:complete len:225 (+) Transcript_5907:953-1627(+)